MCKGENFIQLTFGHDLFHLQLINIDTFISISLFCSLLFSVLPLGLGSMKSKQLKWKMMERNRIEALGRGLGRGAFAKICCPTPPGLSRLFVGPLKLIPGGVPRVDPRAS